MLDAVKKYAVRILLLHLALLILVIGFSLLMARHVRTSAESSAQESARNQAESQTRERLELLADQTARGLESQYQSIFSDLYVILKDESAATSTAPATQTTEPPNRGNSRGGAGGARGGIGRGRGGLGLRVDLSQPVNVNVNTLSTLWRQLGEHGGQAGRVSQMFLVSLNTGNVAISFPENAKDKAIVLAHENFPWLQSIRNADMSGFLFDASQPEGYHLIALPTVDVGVGLGGTGRIGGGGGGGGPGGANNPGPGGGPGGFGGAGRPGDFAGGGGQPGAGGGPGPGGGRGPGGPGGGGAGGGGGNPAGGPTEIKPQFAVVVVVPIDYVREQFLDPLSDQQNHKANVALINSGGDVLSASNMKPGTKLLDQVDASVQGDFENLVMKEHANPESLVLEEPFTLAGKQMPPQIYASAQLEVPSGKNWTVLISSPLSESDALVAPVVNKVVNQVFGASLLGVIFVSLCVTGLLASTSFFMIRSRIRYERSRHELLTRELEQARHIQLAWLPDLKTVPAGIEVSAANLPASHISGDFYNWFVLPSVMQKSLVGGGDQGDAPSGKIAIVIGDVTGHGMAAAFLMATTQLLVRMTLSRYQDAGRCLQEVNKQLCVQSGGFKGQFVTMLVMILDTQHNTLQVASAGHPGPLIEFEDAFRPLELEPQLVLGVNPDEEYHARTFRLGAGSTVILYTDGVVEAQNAAGTQYGTDKLIKLLSSQQNGEGIDPSQRIHTILSDVKRFCNNRELLDDVTLVALRTTAAAVPAGA